MGKKLPGLTILVGITLKGPNTLTRVFSVKDYAKHYGWSRDTPLPMEIAVYSAFLHGAQSVVVIRAASSSYEDLIKTHKEQRKVPTTSTDATYYVDLPRVVHPTR